MGWRAIPIIHPGCTDQSTVLGNSTLLGSLLVSCVILLDAVVGIILCLAVERRYHLKAKGLVMISGDTVVVRK